MFVNSAAPMLLSVFGDGSVSYRSLASLNGQASATPVTLAWCSLGVESRRTRQREYGLEMYYERHGWVITDPTSDKFCGVTDIQIGGRIVDNGREYSIDDAKRRENGKIVDFRCTRVDPVEMRKQDLRGR